MPIQRDEIAVLNRSQLADAEVRRAAAAVQEQIRRDFEPAWGLGARVHFVPKRPHDAMLVVVQDRPVDANDVGYHFQADSGKPVAYVSAADALAADGTISITLSHEILEMLADPAVNLAAERPRDRTRPHRLYAYEVCDPVQEDWYRIDGVHVSNFVFPQWWETIWSARHHHRMDKLGRLLRPFEVHKGGYIDVKDRGDWRQLGARSRRRRHRLRVRQGHRTLQPVRV